MALIAEILGLTAKELDQRACELRTAESESVAVKVVGRLESVLGFVEESRQRLDSLEMDVRGLVEELRQVGA